jgi:hypothetical protein
VYRFLFVPTSADVDALNRALYFKNTNFVKKSSQIAQQSFDVYKSIPV